MAKVKKVQSVPLKSRKMMAPTRFVAERQAKDWLAFASKAGFLAFSDRK